MDTFSRIVDRIVGIFLSKVLQQMRMARWASVILLYFCKRSYLMLGFDARVWKGFVLSRSQSKFSLSAVKATIFGNMFNILLDTENGVTILQNFERLPKLDKTIKLNQWKIIFPNRRLLNFLLLRFNLLAHEHVIKI